MSGNKIAYGEETVLLKLISSNMPEEIIYYDPRLYVYHLVLSKKMTMNWIIRSSFSHGRYSCYFSNKVLVDDIPKINQYLKILQRVFLTLWKIAVSFGWGIFFRPKGQYPYIQNYLYERTLSNIYRLGIFYEHSKQIMLSPAQLRHDI
jgi:hypothetical protein